MKQALIFSELKDWLVKFHDETVANDKKTTSDLKGLLERATRLNEKLDEII